MAEQAPESQDRSLFGLFGKKKEGEGKDNDQIIQPPATHTGHNAAQTDAASYYPNAPQHGVEQCQGHGHEGQFTPEEAEKQKHTGKLRPKHGSGSSSSSSDEEEEGKKKEGGRKKKGAKEKLPGVRNSSDQYGNDGVKKEGLLDKIKDKLPGHGNTNE